MNEADNELLMAAAKAVGLDVQIMALSGPNIMSGPDAGKLWNPLTDDGDALRLLAALPSLWANPTDGGKATAIRRAIVLSAAKVANRASVSQNSRNISPQQHAKDEAPLA